MTCRTMTFVQIQALAKDKPKGEFWAVATHPNAHYDEFVSYLLLVLFGQTKWPGIHNAILVFLTDSDQVTEEQLLTLGVVPVGMCRGRYDEHGRVVAKQICAANLVMTDLDILNGLKGMDGKLDQVLIAAVDRLVEYAVKVDRNPVNDLHAASNDVKDRWSVWSELIKRDLGKNLPPVIRPNAKFFPEDPELAWQMASERIVSDTLADQMLYLRSHYLFFACLKDLVTKKQMTILHFTPPESRVRIRIAIIGPDCEARDAVKAARFAGAHIVFKRSKLGHVGLFPNNRKGGLWAYAEEPEIDRVKVVTEEVDEAVEFFGDEKKLRRRKRIHFGLDTTAILREWRRMEFEHKGLEVPADDVLNSEHLEGSVFMRVGESGMLLWGSQDAGQGSPACPFPNIALVNVVRLFLIVAELEVEERTEREYSTVRREQSKKEEVPQPVPGSLADMPVNTSVG